VVSPWAAGIEDHGLPDTPASATALRIWGLSQLTAVEELRRIGIRCVPWKPEEPLDLALRLLDR